MVKKQRRDINGWLIVDKPLGPTSSKIVYQLRSFFSAKKVGHAGTLDPLASGVLPLAFGKATATIPYMATKKKYRFEVLFGESRSTDDCEGEVTHRCDIYPSEQEIRAVLPQFIGEIMQVPPVYSALQINGKRAYELARKGQAPIMKERKISIYKIDFISRPSPKSAIFEVTCGKGVYVRSLARDIAIACGTVGHVISLRRLKSGPFDISMSFSSMKIMEDNISFNSEVENLNRESVLPVSFLPVAAALDDIPEISVTKSQGRDLICGKHVPVNFDGSENALYKILFNGHVLGLCRWKGGYLHAERMLENHLFFGEF